MTGVLLIMYLSRIAQGRWQSGLPYGNEGGGVSDMKGGGDAKREYFS